MNQNFEKFKKKVEQLFNHYNAGNYPFVIQQVNLLLKKTDYSYWQSLSPTRADRSRISTGWSGRPSRKLFPILAIESASKNLLADRDYAHITGRFGILSRSNSGRIPGNLRGKPYVDGYIVEIDTP